MKKIYKWILWFLFYCFCGWVYEVLIGFSEGRGFINRGFLFGPWLPVYGFGAFLMLPLEKLKKHGIHVVFCLAVLLAVTTELITSYLMEAVNGAWLWDYSQNMFNFQGRIAPWPGIRFGFLSLLLLYIVHPRIQAFTDSIPEKHGRILVLLFGGLFLIDCIARFFLGSNLTDPSLF